MNKPTATRRLDWIDYARGIAIIMVVYRHAYEGVSHMDIGSDLPYGAYLLQESTFNLRMPMFFIVAGIFVRSSLAKRGWTAFTRYKLQTLLYPYLIWTTIQVTVQILAAPYTNFQQDWSGYLDILYQPRELVQFWFLYALLAINLIYAALIYAGNLSKKQMLAIGLMLFYLGATFVQRWFALNDIFFFLIYFAIGDAVGKYLLTEEIAARIASWKSFAVLLPATIAAQYLWLELYAGTMVHAEMDVAGRTVFLVVSIFGEALILQVAFMLAEHNLWQWLRYVGSHSLYIYVMHFLVISTLRVGASRLLGIKEPVLLLVLITIGGIVLPIVFYRISRGTWLEKLFSPKLSEV
ncbi:acyltransferase family protein [Rhodoflexus sp.]